MLDALRAKVTKEFLREATRVRKGLIKDLYPEDYPDENPGDVVPKYKIGPKTIETLTQIVLERGEEGIRSHQVIIKNVMDDYHLMMTSPADPQTESPHSRTRRDKLTKELGRALSHVHKKAKKKKLASEIQQGIDGIIEKHKPRAFRPTYTSTGRFSERMSRPVVEVGRPKRSRSWQPKAIPAPFPGLGQPKPLPPLQFGFRKRNLPNLSWDWDTILEEGDWVRHRGCNGALIMSMDAGQAEDASRGRSTRHLYNADIPKDFKHLRNSLFCCKCGQKVGRRAFRRLKDDPGHFMVDYCDFPELQGRVARTFMYHVPPPPGHNE